MLLVVEKDVLPLANINTFDIDGFDVENLSGFEIHVSRGLDGRVSVPNRDIGDIVKDVPVAFVAVLCDSGNQRRGVLYGHILIIADDDVADILHNFRSEVLIVRFQPLEYFIPVCSGFTHPIMDGSRGGGDSDNETLVSESVFQFFRSAGFQDDEAACLEILYGSAVEISSVSISEDDIPCVFPLREFLNGKELIELIRGATLPGSAGLDARHIVSAREDACNRRLPGAGTAHQNDCFHKVFLLLF